eukprot:scaffold119130_cov33-Tisochrysis_lutea.AAC.1
MLDPSPGPDATETKEKGKKGEGGKGGKGRRWREAGQGARGGDDVTIGCLSGAMGGGRAEKTPNLIEVRIEYCLTKLGKLVVGGGIWTTGHGARQGAALTGENLEGGSLRRETRSITTRLTWLNYHNESALEQPTPPTTNT